MKIKWYDTSCFLITTNSGVRIITDPNAHSFKTDQFKERLEVDVVVITHQHFDHSYIGAIKGISRLYTGGAPAEINGVKFSGVVTHHGANRGLNNIIGIEADGIRILHLGDMGKRTLTDKQLAQVGRVDILMTPWDDNDVCMTHELLGKVLEQLKPKVIFPMHHAKMDEFMTSRKGFTNLRQDNISELKFEADSLPTEEKLFWLKPALGGHEINFEEMGPEPLDRFGWDPDSLGLIIKNDPSA